MNEVLAAFGDSARQAAADSPFPTGHRFRRTTLWPSGEEPPRPVAETAFVA